MRKLRLLKCTTRYEESPWKGKIKMVLGSHVVIWEGEVEETELNPDGRWFYGQTMDLPPNSEANRGEHRHGSPKDGDEDYSYVLQEEIGGAWAYAAHVVPWVPPEEATADDDWDLTDPQAVWNAQVFQDAMER
ncbi:TPA: hypothetical protein DEB00_02675 [Candidatus Uhrbacteria bacterium]|nr:hypothetical protein [Candidatus Uhrbacteria bacterium]